MRLVLHVLLLICYASYQFASSQTLQAVLALNETVALGPVPLSPEKETDNQTEPTTQVEELKSENGSLTQALQAGEDIPIPFGFLHGVASGDPTSSSVVIWTRWTPPDGQDINLFQQSVQYLFSTDEFFEDIIDFGVEITDVNKDFTVKKTVTGLQGGSTYHYKFQASGRDSIVGKTRTLPAGEVDQMRFVVFSGANWRQGFFNVYDAASKVKDLDFLLHLGDFIFESGSLSNPDASEYSLQGRPSLQPKGETYTLSDYRKRHALYRTDEGLQKLLANFPLIASWDDHEISQGAYKSGSETHDQSKGLYEVRKQFAMQAYQEWIPVQQFRRDLGDTYREFYFGQLAVLVLPETRLTFRDAPIDILATDLGRQIQGLSAANWTKGVTAVAIADVNQKINALGRAMVGQVQMSNIEYTARQQGATWYLLGSQTSVGQSQCADFDGALEVLATATRPTFQLLLDAIVESTKTNQILRRCFASGMFNLPHDTEAWAGYPAEKAQLIQALDQRNIENTGRSVVLSNNGGDSAVLAINDDQGNPVAVEFSVPSVTVPGFEFLDVIANETFPDLDWENWFIAT
eukprot:TRINITY_DN755_c1_g1_i4.p1 TRINITY_DN755_c1_g1~~TRINITY_DN755_c1_g1_i4.p1  ORF type:complete len:592 (-),score=44.10 TRINITY_DN755_c1_g1_i4:62-1789(-)